MNSEQSRLFKLAERQRIQVRDWLLGLMRQSPQKPATKEQLRLIAIKKFGVSKSSFDAGWNMAVMDSGNEHWWEPVKRKKRDGTQTN